MNRDCCVHIFSCIFRFCILNCRLRQIIRRLLTRSTMMAGHSGRYR